MKFKDHFSDQAADYARFRPDYPGNLFEYLAGLSSGHELAWDCATGTGQAATGLAAHFNRVIATDASAKQISQARTHSRVTYRVASAEQSGLDAESCDLVTVAQALHWFDLPAFYAETRRVLKKGGLLAVWNYAFLEIAPEIDAVVNHYYNDVVGPYWPPERKLIERGYGELPFPFEELAASPFLMSAQWSLDELLGYLRTWSATQRYRQANGSDPLALIETDLRTEWGGAGERTVAWPLALRVGRHAP